MLKNFYQYLIFIFFIILIVITQSFLSQTKEIEIINKTVSGSSNNFLRAEIKDLDIKDLRSIEEYKFLNSLVCQKEIKSSIGLAEILDFEKIFFEKNKEEIAPIASLTKLMTAVIGKEYLDQNQEIVISSRAEAAYGNFGDFKTGEKYKISDLIDGMLVSSSNDAAMAVAEQLGINQFVSLMNKKAKEIEMEKTYFVDPAGLNLANRSTAADLEKLVHYILEKHPEIFKVTVLDKITIEELNSQQNKTIYNSNTFTQNEKFLGGKTGFLLDNDQGGIISLFQYKDYQILIIVLNGGYYERYEDTKKILNCLAD